MPNSFDIRYKEALIELNAAGLPRRTAVPLHIRLLRRAGLRVRPPHYAPFWANVMLHAFLFALVWGVIMWVLLWEGRVPAQYAAVAAVLSGILFGVVVAFLYRATADRKNLRRWEDLPHR